MVLGINSGFKRNIQMQIEGMVRHAIEFCRTPFCKTSERFDPTNMPFTPGKFDVPMVNLEMFIKADIDQSIIATPSFANG